MRVSLCSPLPWGRGEEVAVSQGQSCRCFPSPDPSPASETRGAAPAVRCIAPPPSFQTEVGISATTPPSCPSSQCSSPHLPPLGSRHGGNGLVHGQARSRQARSNLKPGAGGSSAEPGSPPARRAPAVSFGGSRLLPFSPSQDACTARPRYGIQGSYVSRALPRAPRHLSRPVPPLSGAPQFSPISALAGAPSGLPSPPPPPEHLRSVCKGARPRVLAATGAS